MNPSTHFMRRQLLAGFTASAALPLTLAQSNTATAEIKPVFASTSVRNFGAIGDGVVDDTAAIQTALVHCAKNAMLLVFPVGTYSVSTLHVSNGIAGIFCEGVIKGRGVAPIATLVLGEADAPVLKAIFTLRMDQSAGDLRAVQGNNTSNCMFRDGFIYGFINGASLNHYAFGMYGACTNNTFIGNNISLYKKPTQRGFGIALYGKGGAALPYGGFFDGVVSRAQFPCYGNTITGNVITDGSYAISLQHADYNTVTGNHCQNQNHRSIYLANAAWGNVISSNVLHQYLSSAVLLGYSASHNIVVGNYCETSQIGGEAAINLNTGASFNLIEGNKINSSTNYGVYMGCDMVGNTISNNSIANQYLAAIALENDWIKLRPSNAIFSRPNYGPPPMPYRAWSSKNSTKNVIKGNIIGDGYINRKTAAISLAQIHSDGATSLTENYINDNHVIGQSNLTYNLYCYTDFENKLSKTYITGNNFNKSKLQTNANKFSLAAKWSNLISYFAQNHGFDDILNSEPINFIDGDSTPSVSSNSSFSHQRIYTFASSTTPTNVINFDDGSDGQTITVRLNLNINIIFNSKKIRTKGLMNVTGESTNSIIQFLRCDEVWIETSRNF